MNTILKKLVSKKASSLIEILLSIGIAAIIIIPLTMMTLSSHSGTLRAEKRVAAYGYAIEGIEATRAIRNYDWNNLTNGTHGLSKSPGYYTFTGSSDTNGIYEREVIVSSVDDFRKNVTVNIDWNVTDTLTNTMTLTTRLTNYLIQAFTETSLADFGSGFLNSVQVTNNSGGDVSLDLLGSFSAATVFVTEDFFGLADITDMQRVDNVLYFVTTSDALQNEFFAYDISDITNGNFTQIDSTELTASATGLIVDDGYAYVSTNSNTAEVMIIRLSDFTVVNTINITNNDDSLSIYKEGDLLFVSKPEHPADAEVFVYDVSNPEAAITLTEAEFEIGDAVTALITDGSFVYLGTAGGTDELIVYRISDFAEVNRLDVTGSGDILSFDILGSNLYVGRESTTDELYKIDITDPVTTFVVNDSLSIGARDSLDISIGESYGFAVTGDDGSQELAVIDMSTFTLDTTVDINGTSAANAVEFFGDFVYIGSSDNIDTIQIVTAGIGGWTTPQEIGSYDTTGPRDGLSIYVNGDTVYLGTVNNPSGDEFYIIDVTTPSTPILVDSFEVGANVNDLVVSGDYAYLATAESSKELLILDISTPSAISEVGSYDTDEDKAGLAIAISGDTIYLGTERNTGGGDHELYAINVTVKALPVLLGSLEASSNVNDLVIDGTTLFLASSENSSELIVVDVTLSALMSEIGSLNLSGSANGNAIAFESDTIYLGTSDGTFYTIDVTTSTSPSLIGQTNVGGAINSIFLDTANSRAFVANEDVNEEFAIVDISTLSSVAEVASLDLGAQANGVFMSGDYVYGATDNDSKELFIIGAASAGTEYVRDGIFTSQAFDAGSAVNYDTIEWNESGTGTIQIQIRTASTEAGLESALWVGSDGTTSTYYTLSGATVVEDPSATGTRWIQYRVIMQGDSTATPIFEDITIDYF